MAIPIPKKHYRKQDFQLNFLLNVVLDQKTTAQASISLTDLAQILFDTDLGKISVKTASDIKTLPYSDDPRFTDNRFPSNDSSLVHKTGNESIAGIKTFSDAVPIIFSGITALGQASTNVTQQKFIIRDNTSGNLIALALGTAANTNFGTVAGTATEGNDSRLSNARTPTVHASTHNFGGSDAVDHNLLANYNVNQHRELNDALISSTSTWSSTKVNDIIQSIQAGWAGKEQVKVVSKGLGNQTLSGLQTWHGYTMLAGDRIAVTENTDSIQNGIFIAASTAWARATDFDGNPTGEVKGGSFFYVGTNDNTYKNYRFFVLGSSTNIIVGTDPITFDSVRPTEFGITAGTAAEGNDPRIPTQDENDALVGTNGTPSSANKYVTNSDPRIPSQDENDALVGTNGTPSSANKYVTNSDPRLTDARIPTGTAGGDLTGTYPNPTLSSSKLTDITNAKKIRTSLLFESGNTDALSFLIKDTSTLIDFSGKPVNGTTGVPTTLATGINYTLTVYDNAGAVINTGVLNIPSGSSSIQTFTFSSAVNLASGYTISIVPSAAPPSGTKIELTTGGSY